MSNTVLRLLKTYLKPNIRWKHGFNSCDKGSTQEIVTTAAAVTSTMHIVEYHVEYNTTTDQTHLKQTTVVVGGKGKPIKKGYHCSNKYYLKHIVRVLLDRLEKYLAQDCLYWRHIHKSDANAIARLEHDPMSIEQLRATLWQKSNKNSKCSQRQNW